MVTTFNWSPSQVTKIRPWSLGWLDNIIPVIYHSIFYRLVLLVRRKEMLRFMFSDFLSTYVNIRKMVFIIE